MSRWPEWTEAEDEVLRAVYPSAGPVGVMEKLPARTTTAIYSRAEALGVRRALRDAPETPGEAARWWGLRVDRERARTLFWEKVEKGPGCWLWQGGLDRDGYGKFQLSVPRQNRQLHVRAHVFSWEDENGQVPSGMLLIHGCDSPRCVRPAADHVRPGDQATNLIECVARARHPASKLTPDQVREIRLRSASGETALAIAKVMGRPRATIYSVLHGRTWGWMA